MECRMRWVSRNEAEKLSEFAVSIAREYYTYIKSKDVEKYIAKDLSLAAVERNMDNMTKYAWVLVDDVVAGYFSYNTSDETLILDKMYLSAEYRGKGIGTQVMEWVFNIAKSGGYRIVEITVVDFDENAMAFYKHKGFEFAYSEKVYSIKRSIFRKTFRSAELFNTYYI